MNEFKYQLTQLVFLILLGVGAYWALTNLDSGISYTRENIVENIEQNNTTEAPADTVLASDIVEDNLDDEDLPVVVTTPVPVETQDSSDLISDLKGLIDANVTMDSGANGPRVGIVQKFLAEYFTNKTISIDNDFGPTTKGLVRDFQRAELNGGDGRIGPNTLRAMVEYLEN